MRNDLEAAFRKRKRMMLLPDLLSDLSNAVGRQVKESEIADLQVSEQIWKSILDKRMLCSNGGIVSFHQTWLSDERQGVIDTLIALKNVLDATPVLVFRSLSRYCGAFKTSSTSVLERALHFVSLDQEDLIASSEDTSCGLWLSFDTNRVDGRISAQFQLTIWGEAFLRAVLK